MPRHILILGVLILLSAARAIGQDLSHLVFPSEDELAEAFHNGDISFLAFVQLSEIALYGIDSERAFLLDEIPNLIYLTDFNEQRQPPLEQEQAEPFTRRADQTLGGSITHRYSQLLEENGQFKYYTTGEFRIGHKYRASFQLRRDTNARERVVGRSLSYRSNEGVLNRLTLGSFSTRLGLGTTFGYRGKLLKFSRNYDSESLLYPDFGGYNGIYLDMTTGITRLRALGSINRDGNHRVGSVGAHFTFGTRRLIPGLLVGANQLRNQGTRRILTLPMVGLTSAYTYDRGRAAGEVSLQGHGEESAVSLVAEGHHRVSDASVRWAAWSYEDNFVDISSGSKAGNLRRSQSIDEVDMILSTKRSGQHGLLLKTTADLGLSWQLINELIWAGFDDDNQIRQYATGLVRPTTDGLWQVTYLKKFRRRWSAPGLAESEKDRWQLERRQVWPRLALRSYVAWWQADDDKGFLSLFLKMRYHSTALQDVELWSHLDRMTSDGIGYVYVYLRGLQELSENISAGVKLALVYSRDRGDRTQSTITFEIRTTL